jgi:Domain of unknown function (DUF6484)
MATNEDTVFQPFIMEAEEVLESLLPDRAAQASPRVIEPLTAPTVGVLVGFDLDDRPVVSYRNVLGGERVAGRTTVALKRSQIGSSVVILCEDGDPHLPIVVGVIESRANMKAANDANAPTVIQADDERYIVTAEREIVLRCGEASITLTRAGKVIIKGTYVLSRSSGYNKIKGAAVDIN